MTAVFSTVFFVSERITARRAAASRHGLEQFNLQPQETIAPETVAVRPGNTLCPVRDYNSLDHLRRAMELTHTGKQDLVVMTVHPLRGPNTGYRNLTHKNLFTDYEQTLFTRGRGAGREGRQARGPHGGALLEAGPGDRPGRRAALLRGDQWSPLARDHTETAGLRFARPGRPCPGSRPTRCGCACSSGTDASTSFVLGAHPPSLTTRDVNLIHELWVVFRSACPRPTCATATS